MSAKRASFLGVTTCAALVLLGGACEDAAAPPVDGAVGADAPADAGADTAGPGGNASFSGTVKDRAGVVVASARIETGASAADSDAQGKFTLAGLAPGPVLVKVTRNWFKPFEATVTAAAGAVTPFDITLDEIPLKIEAADRALADGYNAAFDWTEGTLSIVIVPRPSRQDFDNAVYFHNPALYRDTTQEPPLTPAPQPQIVAGVATGFTFPIRGGAQVGKEALELATVVDAIKDTPLVTEPASFMMWAPLINWLSEGEAAKSADLKAAGVAVRQQNWGGNSLRPQEIEKVYLDATGALWVKVVFAGFVQLGPGINDDDGDGRKEIYAKIAPAHYPSELIDKLKSDYIGKTFSTHGLSKEVSKSLNELYSTTGASVERYIGQPFDVPGVGTVSYPFVVMKHLSGHKNVIIVGPAP